MSRRPQAGLTLIEVMIASAVMVIMMALAWRTISNTSDSRSARSSSTRSATTSCGWRWAASSRTSSTPTCRATRTRTQSHPRTMFIAKSGSQAARDPVLDARPPRAVGRRERVRADGDLSTCRATTPTSRGRPTGSVASSAGRRTSRPRTCRPSTTSCSATSRASSSSSGTGRTSTGRTPGTRPSPMARRAGCRAACGSRSRSRTPSGNDYKLVDPGADPDAGTAELRPMKPFTSHLDVPDHRALARRGGAATSLAAPAKRRQQRGDRARHGADRDRDHARDLEPVRHLDEHRHDRGRELSRPDARALPRALGAEPRPSS